MDFETNFFSSLDKLCDLAKFLTRAIKTEQLKLYDRAELWISSNGSLLSVVTIIDSLGYPGHETRTNVWQRTYKCNVSGYIWLSLHIAQRNFIFLSLLGTIYSLIFNHFSLLSLCILSLLIHAIFLSIKTRISLLKISITKIKDSLLDLIMHQRDEKIYLNLSKRRKEEISWGGKNFTNVTSRLSFFDHRDR